jgi:hypothetical protein
MGPLKMMERVRSQIDTQLQNVQWLTLKDLRLNESDVREFFHSSKIVKAIIGQYFIGSHIV